MKFPETVELAREYASLNYKTSQSDMLDAPHLFNLFLTEEPDDLFLFCQKGLSEGTFNFIAEGKSKIIEWWENPQVPEYEKEFGLCIWPELRELLSGDLETSIRNSSY